MSCSPRDISHHDTENSLKRLDTPTANEFSEAILLQNDMRSSFDAMRIWVERYSDKNDLPSSEQTIAQSLFRDAIVQFVGCFDKSTKYSISPHDVYGNTDGGIRYFRWLKDIRDAYAAHKFGALRQCVVGVIVDTSSSKILGVGHLANIYAGPASGGRMILRFMQIAIDYHDLLVDGIKAKLAKEAHNLSSAELKALPIARVYGVNPDEVRITRTKFQKARTGNPPAMIDSS